MIINHNIAALDTWRQLGVNEGNLNDSLAKLSSGLRINTAADDAAGLAISEKMRAQISGLDQAQRNAQDGISMIQTAEGALNETHSILQRMRELAVQASNDTLTTEDRGQIQKEVDQLSQEISRISNTTEFNTKNLLAGGFKNQTLQIGANQDQTLAFSVGAMDAKSLGVTAGVGATVAGGAEVASASLVAGGSLNTDTYTLSGTVTTAAVQSSVTLATNTAIKLTAVNAGADGNNIKVAVVTGASEGVSVTTAAGVTTITVTADTAGGAQQSHVVDLINNDAKASSLVTAALTGADAAASAEAATSLTGGADAALSVTLSDSAGNVVDTESVAANTTAGTAPTVTMKDTSATNALALTLNAATIDGLALNATFNDNTIDVVGKASTAAVTANGVVTSDATVSKGILVDTQANAENAITAINDAINTVSSQRANLGALQDRLEHTITNLGTASQNLTAAESRIRDVDMAKEIMSFTKDQILVQAGTSMLAQAKALPQSVLQLLR